MKNIKDFSQSSRQEIQDMKTIVDRTYDLVVDTRYKVIQMVNVSALYVFFKDPVFEWRSPNYPLAQSGFVQMGMNKIYLAAPTFWDFWQICEAK